MNNAHEALRRSLTALPGVTEVYPYKPRTRAFQVGGMTFALTRVDDKPPCVSLKGNPDENEADRAEYPVIRPGPLLNKRCWNTIPLDGSLPDDVLDELIEASYTFAWRALSRATRAALLTARPEETP